MTAQSWNSSCANPTDSRDDERDRQTIDQSSASYDPDCAGVGATYYGDATSSRIFIPTNFTSATDARYLFRLASISCEEGSSIRIRGLRQAVGIGVLLKSRDQEAPSQVPMEMDQLSPFWRFPDGNICWGLRAIFGPPGGGTSAKRILSAGEAADYLGGADSARILSSNPAVRAPAKGFFPGTPIGSLGLFRDLRFPWSAQGAIEDMDIELRGPVNVGLWAAVKQTDPITRQSMNNLLPVNFMPPLPEDQFLVACERAGIPGILYRHISGAIVAEIGPQSRVPGINPVLGRTPT